MSAPAVQLVGLGAPARDALWDLVELAKGDDPLTPVTVAVPSPYAGLSLRRELGARRGLVNVRFMALARVAELLGAPALAVTGRRPLAGPLRNEAVHAALVAEPGPFAAVAEHPSTTARLAATFHDLSRAGCDPSALAGRGARAEAVARLYANFRERTSDYYDEDDLLVAATAAIERGGDAPGDLGDVIVWLPTALAPAEEGFVRALAHAGRASVVLGLTGDESVDRPQARALAARLGLASSAIAAVGAPPIITGTRILAAPDPEDEVRAVVRRIVAAAQAGAALHELAILYRLDEPYARLVPEVLDAAGVAWNGPSPRRLADGLVARVLLGVLRLADTDLARDEVAAWLASGPILDADGHRVAATRWDVVSREAGVVSSAAQWANRLEHHRAELDRALAEARADDELAGRVGSLQADLDTTVAFAAFITELAERIAPPTESTWAAHAAWATALVDRYVGGQGRRASWPEPELEAARRVEATLVGLGALDELDAPVDAARFRRALADQLDIPFGRVASFGTGVFVGPLRNAYGTGSSCVFVLGMAEGSFPPRGREDPLLPDSDRRVLGGLTLHTERKAEERRDYLAVLSSAPERVLCFPRADPRSQRRRLPAPWLLETATALEGSNVAAYEFLTLGDRPWLEVVSSFEEGMRADVAPASPTEYDVRALADWRAAELSLVDHPLSTGALGAGFAAAEARASHHLTEYDGLVSNRGLGPDATHPISATALQDWAYCPFRYLLARVLRVREVPKPERTDTISALDEGTLVHAILEEFMMRATPRTSPDEPWGPQDRALLREIAVAHCDAAAQRGITGRPLHWLLARRRILGNVEQFPAIDEASRARLGVVAAPDGLEVEFGDATHPVELALGDGRSVAFKGRIDRVDRSPDGTRAVVYDYKTGRAHKVAAKDPIDAGQSIQLPIYAHAAQARWGANETSAFYWYTRIADESALVEFPVDDEHRTRFIDVVTTIVDGIDGGCFVAYPGPRDWDWRVQRETYANCIFCPYDRVCPPDRLGAWERKEADGVVVPFHGLELAAPDATDETSSP